MKRLKHSLLLVAICLTGCGAVDPIDWKPIYSIVNHTNEDIVLTYTLQQSVADMGFKQTESVELGANDTIVLEFFGEYDSHEQMKPAKMFSMLLFESNSGENMQKIVNINDEDWVSYNISEGEQANMFAYGWMYVFQPSGN